MDNLKDTLKLNSADLQSAETRSLDGAAAKTAPLPRLDSSDKSLTQRKVEDFRNGQGRILQMIAANASLGEVLKRLMHLIEAQSPGMRCSVLLLSEDGEHMRHGAAPSLPDEYVQAVDGGPIGPKNGSCGTAMYRGEPVFVTDMFSDPLWEDYRDAAAMSKMRACWSTPIMSGRGKVLGSFAMYYEEPRTPTGDEAALTEVATRIAGLAIEHHAAREILQRTQAELAQATHAASSGKVAVSVADEVHNQLQAILNNTKKCFELLDEDQPDIASFREPLKNIDSHGQRALEVLAKIRAQK